MIDAYEQKHGPVDDRSIFDGEIIVPQHLRNVSINSLKTSRLHGGSLFGSLSRSRTFLNLSANARHSYHGSVPDLSLDQCTFINPINQSLINDDHRRLSSSSAATKITMNSSTTLTLSDSNYFSNSTDINSTMNSSILSRINNTSVTSDNDQNATIDNGDSFMPSDPISNRQRTSTNRIQMQKSNDQKRFLYCKSLDRPMRTHKTIANYGTNSTTTTTTSTTSSHFKKPRSSSIDTKSDSNANDSYMTLIHTHVPIIQRVTLNRNHGSSLSTATSLHDINLIETIQPQMTTTTSTFQRKNPPQMLNNLAAGFSRDLTLDNVTKFKLPRVTLSNPSSSNQRQ